MATKKLSTIARITSAPGSALLMIVVDPDGTPVSYGIKVEKLFANVSVNTVHTANVTITGGSLFLTGKVRPSSAVPGQVYFDSENNHFYGFNGTVWVQLD